MSKEYWEAVEDIKEHSQSKRTDLARKYLKEGYQNQSEYDSWKEWYNHVKSENIEQKIEYHTVEKTITKEISVSGYTYMRDGKKIVVPSHTRTHKKTKTVREPKIIDIIPDVYDFPIIEADES